MIKSFKITNSNNETLVLDLFNPELSGFAVQQVRGLGPVKATINMANYASKDGSKFQGSRRGSRNIDFDLVFLDSNVSIEQVRHQSYAYFPIGEKLDIEIETDTRSVKTTGYVETNEPSIWGSDLEGCSVSVKCESPFFNALTSTVYNLTSTIKAFHFPFTSTAHPNPELLFGYINLDDTITILNTGHVKSGCIFELQALQDISDPLIYNKTNKTYFGLNLNMNSGDLIKINTVVGEKKVELIRANTSYNVINYLKEGSTWFQLDVGATDFSISHSDLISKNLEGNSGVAIEFNIAQHKYEVGPVEVHTKVPTQAKDPTITKPVEVSVSSNINFTFKKEYWSDSATDTSKYNVTTVNQTYTKSLSSLISNGTFAKGYIDVTNRKFYLTHMKFYYHNINGNTTQKDDWGLHSKTDDTGNKYRYQGYYFKKYTPASGTVALTVSQLKPETTLYSNRFKYHPEMNNAAAPEEISYYFKSLGTNVGVMYWDLYGRPTFVEAQKYSNKKSQKSKYNSINNRWKDKSTWPKNNKTYFIAELKTPIEFDISDMGAIYNAISYDFAVPKKITLTANGDNTAKMSASRNIIYTYNYYNGSPVTDLEISDGCAGDIMYLRFEVPYKSGGYTSYSFNITNSDEIVTQVDIDWSDVDEISTFYGGYIDPINGLLYNKYNSSGGSVTGTTIDISDEKIDVTPKTDAYRISVIDNVGTINRLIYPVPVGAVLERINLIVTHNNLYVGI